MTEAVGLDVQGLGTSLKAQARVLLLQQDMELAASRLALSRKTPEHRLLPDQEEACNPH